jgi:colanic acid/amylovoran biosynthesis glycosyltransferase
VIEIPGRLAYLTGRYPKISHTFVYREVEALRALAVEVDTFSIHRTPDDQLLSDADRRAAETTFCALPPNVAGFLRAHLWALLRHPARYISTVVLAVRVSPPGLKGKLWQLGYFAIAVLFFRRCIERGIRHVHAQFADSASDIAWLISALGGPGWSWSLMVHGPVEFRDIGRNRLPEKVESARLVMCISDFARSQVMSLVDDDQWGKIHVIHCGLWPDQFAPTDAADEPADRPLRVVNVGRLVPLKGQAVLIEAISILAARGVPFELEIIGDGPDRERLERRARERALDGAVRFAGPVGQDAIRERYARADVFCMSSFAEGVPVVLMEAMAMEKPVVSTRIMGVPELVDEGVSGLLVPPGRADLLANALARLAGWTPERRREMGRAGRRKVMAEYDVAKSAQDLSELYARVLAS